MQAALHQQLRLAFMDQLHRLGSGCLAAGSVDQLETPDVETMFPGDGLDPLGRADEDRNEQAVLRRLYDTGERAFVAWMHHGAPHRRNLLGAIDQVFVFRLVVRHHALALRSVFAPETAIGSAST